MEKDNKQTEDSDDIVRLVDYLNELYTRMRLPHCCEKLFWFLFYRIVTFEVEQNRFIGKEEGDFIRDLYKLGMSMEDF